MDSLYKLSSAHQSLDFPSFSGEPTKYVIACQPRTGSHLLGQLLYRTRQAGCPLEYFHSRHWQEWCRRCRTKNALKVSNVLLRRRTSPNGAFGVKTHWPQFEALLKLGLETRFHDAKFIYLAREDVLGQAISHVIAQQSGVWVQGQSKRKEPVYSYRQIASSVGLILDQRRQWETFFCFAGVTALRITYESLRDERERQLRRVLEFIGVTHELNADVLAADPILPQHTGLNEQWRERFLAAAAMKHDERNKWRSLTSQSTQQAQSP